ncbi:hypothetical protein E1265_01690 [Streptomyces sp. 8K308]|uniref:hypothetical protein n=1 Tax=Streptomyces sp. 8K308 TaxID=2530388 RepID=UPI001050C497|nr:hypothetical protein [Streptomyces sp. 8K308]TDC27427.1 hypothetical protein E1265_01690 [Streptomyces sp. 8K308]
MLSAAGGRCMVSRSRLAGPEQFADLLTLALRLGGCRDGVSPHLRLERFGVLRDQPRMSDRRDVATPQSAPGAPGPRRRPNADF